jgi:short-subunit dehydrogenase
MVLAGRVAAITGASSGIGLACAKHLAREGVAVVLGARRVSLLEATAHQIQAAGGRAAVVQMDVTRAADSLALVGMAVREFGRLDVMICNAGFGYYAAIDETPADVMQRMMDVNYMGTFHGAAAALPIFRAQNSGHLIFVSSIVGRRGIPQMGAYTATKAAQAGLAESLRAEFNGSPIHVSCVYPVSTPTEFVDAMARDFGHRISGLGPKQSVDDVAAAIVRCVERPRPEVYPHKVSRGLTVLNALLPGFTDSFVRKYGRHRVVSHG